MWFANVTTLEVLPPNECKVTSFLSRDVIGALGGRKQMFNAMLFEQLAAHAH